MLRKTFSNSTDTLSQIFSLAKNLMQFTFDFQSPKFTFENVLDYALVNVSVLGSLMLKVMLVVMLLIMIVLRFH